MVDGILDLSSAWLKLERAKHHADCLDSEIGRTFAAKGYSPVFRREFDSETNIVTAWIEGTFDIPEQWGILIGDALHNFRCALDHLTWQLAIRHLGREPEDERTIRQIQFPILSRCDQWPPAVAKHISGPDATTLESLQPYHGRDEYGFHALEVLATLSNIDKHRIINPILLRSLDATLRYQAVDCRVLHVELHGGLVDLEDGAEAMEITVEPTGPNPDVQLDGKARAYIGFREVRYPVFGTFEAIGVEVARVLGLFDPGS